ncbi:MAG TPA: hypothetical protein VF743_12095, partial [Acidimicrobiales bacterium]
SRKARNLAADPRCVVTPERADEAVVVEGVATRVTDPAAVERVADAYRAKYGSGFPDPADNPLLAVRPTRAFGVVEEEPGFTTRTTRWTWSPAG